MYLMYSFFLRFTTFLSTYLWGSSTVIYIYIYSCSILHFHVLYMFNEQQDHWQDDQENPHEASIFCGSKGLLAAPGCLLVIPGVCCHGEWLWSFAGLLPMEFCERSHSFLEMERFVKDALKYGWMMVNVECTTYHIFFGGFVFCSLKPETISQNITVYRRNCSYMPGSQDMDGMVNKYGNLFKSGGFTDFTHHIVFAFVSVSWKPMGKQQLKAWSRSHSATSTIP